MASGDQRRLDDRVAIVTGVDEAIGRVLALAVADAGADVVCVGSSASDREPVVAEIAGRGRRAIGVGADLSRAVDAEQVVARATAEYGRIDILVNAAGGIFRDRPALAEISEADWRAGIDANLTAAFYTCRAAVPPMADAGGGCVLNVTSGLGLRGARDNYMYGAGKAAVVNLTRTLAVTYGERGIRVNGIAPGMFREAGASEERAEFVPVGRVGELWELGPLAVFLCSAAAAGISGETVVQDGGGLAAGIAPTGWAPRIPLPGGVA